MDVQLFVRVLWRFRVVVVIGFFLAVALAFLTYAQVSLGGGGIEVTPRGGETWQSQSRMLITQTGFPEGRAVPKYTEPDPKSETPPVQLGDPTRFSGLSQIYAGLANSDLIRAQLAKEVPVQGSVTTEPAADPVTGEPLPMLNMTATAGTAEEAVRLVRAATDVFRDYVAEQQNREGIPAAERVQLELLERGASPELVSPRSKTLPGLVFVAIAIATLALAFVLENLRPRLRPVQAPAEPVQVHPGADAVGVSADRLARMKAEQRRRRRV